MTLDEIKEVVDALAQARKIAERHGLYIPRHIDKMSREDMERAEEIYGGAVVDIDDDVTGPFSFFECGNGVCLYS